MRVRIVAAAAAAAVLWCGGVAAAPKKPPAAKRPAPAAAAPAPAEEPLNDAQREIARHVFVGRADCEFAQTVDVQPLAGEPGRFSVVQGKQRYTMSPQETTTGAVRLEDRARGVVWIQIPAKSMLMDMKAGRRLVDACLHAEQRGAAATVATLGIAPGAAAPAAPAAAAEAPVGSPGPRDAEPRVNL